MNIHDQLPSYETMLVNEALTFYRFNQAPVILVGHSGMNNTTRVIVDGDQRFNLRIYNNHQDEEKLYFEHYMLFLLQQQKLAIETPVPVLNQAGTTITRLSNGKLAAMFYYIEGERPDLNRAVHVAGLGHATAILSAGLANVNLDAEPAYSPYFDIANNYSALTSERIKSIIADNEQLAPLNESFQLIMQERIQLEQKSSMFAQLPTQWIHGDINSSNSLARADQVIGIIDFEFVTRDARVMELAVLLSEMIKPNQVQLAQNLRMMKQAYDEHITLKASEEAALQDLIKLRAVDVAMHFIGRYEEQLDDSSVLQNIIIGTSFTLQYMNEHRI